MIVSKKRWDKFISDLRKVNDTATEKMMYYLQEFGIPQTNEEMEQLIDAAFNISQKYGEAAATLAAEFYDEAAVISKAYKAAAEPAPNPTIGEVAKTIRGTCKTNNPEIISSSIGRLVKRTGVDTTLKNALRDGAEFAWVPRGETCAFCLTLASRGWQRASKYAIKNGHAEHIHANCDCTYAIRFDKSSGVAGYDPAVYEKMYRDADGSTPTDKINFLRREFYAENKEEINEAKRDNYAKRMELNSSEAEEFDV